MGHVVEDVRWKLRVVEIGSKVLLVVALAAPVHENNGFMTQSLRKSGEKGKMGVEAGDLTRALETSSV